MMQLWAARSWGLDAGVARPGVRRLSSLGGQPSTAGIGDMPVRRMDSKRVANQTMFRSVNERIRDLNEEFSAQLDLDPQFVCECPDLGCIEPISMSPTEFRRIREKPTWFILVPAHIDTEFEEVIETHEGFSVVAVPEHLLPDQAENS